MRNQWLKRFGVAGTIVLAAAGCATTHAERIDDSRLAGIPADQMQPVAQAQDEVTQARQDQEAAKQARADAETQLKLAKSELDVAQSRFDQVKQQRDIELKNMHEQEASQFKGAPLDEQPQPLAGQAPTPPPTPQAPTQVQAATPQQLVSPADFLQASTALEEAKAKVGYLSKLVDIAKSNQTLADRKLDLANSKVELARFQVLNQSNPAETEAMKLNEAKFDADVAQKHSKVAEVQGKLGDERREAREAYNKWSALDKQLSEMPGGNYRSAAVPPPPRG